MVEVIVNEEKLILGVPYTKEHFARYFEFPLANIASVGTDSSLVYAWFKRREFLAEFVQSVMKEGVFYEDADCIYWEVKDPDRTIVIFLQNEPHEKMIVEVENPARAVEVIENALRNKEPESEEKESEIEEPDNLE